MSWNNRSVSLGVSVAVGSSITSRRALAREGLGDLDQLLFGDDQRARARVRVDLEADLAQHLARRAAHRRVVEQPATLQLAAEEDVLGHGEVLGEVELLVDEDDARGLGGARIGEATGDAVDRQLAFARRLVTGEDLHQRRLAGAVLAEQAVDLARLELEANVVQHAHGAEVLADAGEGDAQAHRGATQVPPAADEATAASMKATPAMPSSIVGN